MTPHLTPNEPAPALRFETLGHGIFDLAVDAPPGGSFVVFHRGAQCKWGRRALKEVDDRIGDLPFADCAWSLWRPMILTAPMV